MNLTPEQEQQIIEENMPKIYRSVDNFTARCRSKHVSIPYDEFVQDVSIAFLLYIRKCETMEQINRFPWFTAMSAMRKTVYDFQPMKCTHSDHRFREIIHSMPQTISIDCLAKASLDVNGMSKHWVDDKDTMMDFESFMDACDENTRRLIAMRYGGMTLKELANQYGVNKSTVMRRIRKLADEYHEFADDPEQKGAENAH